MHTCHALTMYTDLEGRVLTNHKCRNLLFISAVLAFSIGLTFGLLLAVFYLNKPSLETNLQQQQHFQDEEVVGSVLVNNSHKYNTVSFLPAKKTSPLLEEGIFWGRKVEEALPEGFQKKEQNDWEMYLKGAIGVKLEKGCGRMQNRMVVFQDGRRGCVRYRQNTDQIQGELFSFYLGRLLQLPNLAPSSVSVVDLRRPLWLNLAEEVAKAQWQSMKVVVLTQHIPELISADIPHIFRPTERHLNRLDIVANMSDGQSSLKTFVELAQWSDLIIFDYLTANLDRVVNNLYNYQWNNEIMNAPAHNLARRRDLLLFLDNESGLLHGYRLLKKYEVYHVSMLENLCVFRKKTVEVIRELKMKGDVGLKLKKMFEEGTSGVVKEFLPGLPEKSVKILNERIDRVWGHIVKCQQMFGEDFNKSDDDDGQT